MANTPYLALVTKNQYSTDQILQILSVEFNYTQSFFENNISTIPEISQIYTDASKNKNVVGFAIITDQENRIFQLNCSRIYTTETYAIYEELKINSSSNLISSNIIISDYFCAISLISNPFPKYELVQHIQKLITEIKNHYIVC